MIVTKNNEMAIGDRFSQGNDNLSPISEICDSKSHPT